MSCNHLLHFSKTIIFNIVEWYRASCQSTNDVVVGCAQYLKTEMERFPCPGGYEYECCVINRRNEDLFQAPNSTNFGKNQTNLIFN